MQLTPGIFTQVHFVIMNLSKVLGFACCYWILQCPCPGTIGLFKQRCSIVSVSEASPGMGTQSCYIILYVWKSRAHPPLALLVKANNNVCNCHAPV